MIKGLLLAVTTCAFSIISLQLIAQSVIHGIVKDARRKTYCNLQMLLLLNSTDSSLVKGIITDAQRKISFENIKTGHYLISASFTGCRKYLHQNN